MRLRLLAIVWIMTLTIAVDAAEKSRRNARSLFNDRARREDFELFGNWGRTPGATTEPDPRAITIPTAEHTIQLDRISSSKSHKRSPRRPLESSADEALFQNDLIDPESLKPHIRVKRRSNLRRSLGKSPSYVHRIPRRTYERFLSEEMNPADESEAEYGGSVDDDIDVPGVFLSDEITNKRNKLEDVYPDVKSHSTKRDHSPPEFLKETRDEDGSTRRKRDKEEEADCDYEEGEEYYYDEEDETANQKGEVQGQRKQVSKDAAEISAAKETVDESQSKQEETQTFENNQDAKIEGVGHLNSPAREKYVVAVKGKSSANSPAKKPSNQKHEKPKAKKKPVAPKKTNNKKPPAKSKPHPPKKPKPMPRKPKSNLAALVDSDSDQLKNQKGNAECCGQVAKKERNKITKTIVVKAIPRSESLQELQIYEKPSGTKEAESGKPAAKSNVVEGKADMSMGEMKDLLTRLIGKVDDLHNLVSEIRSDKVDRVESNSHHVNCIAKARQRAAGG